MKSNVAFRTIKILALMAWIGSSIAPVSGQARASYFDIPGNFVTPSDWDGSQQLPLVVFLPPTGGTANQLAAWIQGGKGPRGYIALMPAGTPGASDYLPDFASYVKWFEARLQLDLAGGKVKYSIDPSRTYLCGFSLGADLAWALAARDPDQFHGLLLSGSQCSYPIDQKALDTMKASNFQAWFAVGNKDQPNRINGEQKAAALLTSHGVSAKYISFEGGHQPAPPDLFNAALGSILPIEPEKLVSQSAPLPGPVWVPWDPSSGTVPASALFGSDSNPKTAYYVARTLVDGALTPGRYSPSMRRGWVPHQSKEIIIARESLEILTDPQGVTQWVPGEAGQIPPEAIQGGQEADGTPLYIARSVIHGVVVIDKVSKGSQGASTSWAKNEVPVSGNVEYLVLKARVAPEPSPVVEAPAPADEPALRLYEDQVLPADGVKWTLVTPGSGADIENGLTSLFQWQHKQQRGLAARARINGKLVLGSYFPDNKAAFFTVDGKLVTVTSVPVEVLTGFINEEYNQPGALLASDRIGEAFPQNSILLETADPASAQFLIVDSVYVEPEGKETQGKELVGWGTMTAGETTASIVTEEGQKPIDKEHALMEAVVWHQPWNPGFVKVGGFLISRYNTTWGEFRQFADETNLVTRGQKVGGFQYGEGGQFFMKLNWRDDGPPRSSSFDRNVTAVDWYEALAYCNWRSKKEGLTPAYQINGNQVTWDRTANGFRLPTVAEWELAAQGGDGAGTPAKWIETRQLNSSDVGAAEDWYVGTTLTNHLGLYDMYNTIDQWCWDVWVPGAGDYLPPTTSDGVKIPLPSGIDWRAVRGGNYEDSSRYHGYHPFWDSNAVGFRVVRNAP
jgi:formylglycine-generating enzyme required for sulfatase activity/pimeloyl-ACP methyl ester carboxylesterase